MKKNYEYRRCEFSDSHVMSKTLRSASLHLLSHRIGSFIFQHRNEHIFQKRSTMTYKTAIAGCGRCWKVPRETLKRLFVGHPCMRCNEMIKHYGELKPECIVIRNKSCWVKTWQSQTVWADVRGREISSLMSLIDFEYIAITTIWACHKYH